MSNTESSKIEEKSSLKNSKKIKWFTLKKLFYGSLSILIFSILLLKFKFHFNIFISLILSILLVILIVIIVFQLFLKKIGNNEPWHDLYGQKIINLPYFKNDIIINSFKKNGDNFKEDIGEINDGKDYQKNKRNYYNLFIPYSSLKNKNKFNRIILFIHGGSWRYGKKEDIEFMCSRYAKYGFITASMNYSLLNKKIQENTIFKNLDEINSCVTDIKYQLKNEGFDENKLEMAIGGVSAGAHLSLLYAYSMKNIPIPIKFAINIVGPMTLESDYWYKIKDDNILENIEPEDIENAIKENKIIKTAKDLGSLYFMNAFIGNKFSKEDLNEMLENEKIKYENEKYKELFKIAKYTFINNHIIINAVPTLCEYGGKDGIVGVAHYSYLKKLSEKYGNKIELVYMKDGGHILESYDTKDGINAMREMHYQILKFAKTYFTLDEQEKLLFNI